MTLASCAEREGTPQHRVARQAALSIFWTLGSVQLNAQEAISTNNTLLVGMEHVPVMQGEREQGPETAKAHMSRSMIATWSADGPSATREGSRV
jgi:hypothetical protein